MLSVYFHAHRKVGPKDLDDAYVWLRPEDMALLPPELHPIPIEQAAKIIYAAKDEPHGQTNRARAVAQLAAARLHHRPEYHSAFRLLGVEPERFNEIPPADQPGADDHRPQYENDALDILMPVPVVGCSRRKKDGNATLDEDTLVTSGEATVEVHRDSAQELRLALDPLRWSACHAGMHKTFVPRRLSQVFPVNGDHDCEKDPVQPSPGSVWSETLFEHFRIHWNLLTFSSFRNLFNIRCRTGPNTVIHVDYRLATALRSRILLDNQLGGLDRNDGIIKAAARSDGWYDVKVTKDIRFTSRGGGPMLSQALNRLARWVLGTQLDDEVYSTVCCAPQQAEVSSEAGLSSGRID